MSGILIGVAAVGAAGTIYGAVEQNQADQNAAAVDTATAQFNARLDAENAQQIDLDTQQNIDTERQSDATYLSREAAGYAASGVLATSGSALRAQITNVGRMTQQIQQQYQQSQIQQQNLYESAKVGVAEGNAQASADSAAGTLALIDGGASLAGQALGDYYKIGGSSSPGGNPAPASPNNQWPD